MAAIIDKLSPSTSTGSKYYRTTRAAQLEQIERFLERRYGIRVSLVGRQFNHFEGCCKGD